MASLHRFVLPALAALAPLVLNQGCAWQSAPLAPMPGERFQDELSSGGNAPPMVAVPAGSFAMGSPPREAGRYRDEGPVRRVAIAAPFAIGVREVTFAEWDACVAAGGCGGYQPEDEGWGRGERPVINVSWQDAQAYVEWLSQETGARYRLPSEAEWEYAARAGTTTPFHTGETISTEQANFDGRLTYGAGQAGAYRRRTLPAGSFRANAFGLHDVHGNVWEWVQDCRSQAYAETPVDGSAWERPNCSRRVLRGGAWLSSPRNLRAAVRVGGAPDCGDALSGFRVARTLAP